MAKESEKIQDLEGEVWKDIQGYEGLYQISNKGRVKSIARFANDRNNQPTRNLPEKIKKSRLSSTGYLVVSLNKKNIDNSKIVKIHRLIAIHFIPNPKNKECVNHIDGDKLNNSLDNLEWVTKRENACHAKMFQLNSHSKHVGILRESDRNKWRAQIRHNGKIIQIGRYDTEEEAYEARRKFEQDNGIENKYL